MARSLNEGVISRTSQSPCRGDHKSQKVKAAAATQQGLCIHTLCPGSKTIIRPEEDAQ